MSWKKDGIEFVPPLIVDGIAWRQPSDDMLIAAGYVWEDPPAPPIPTVYTKRKIRLAMRKMGIEEKLDSMLADKPIATAWAEAQEINLANPDFTAAFAASTVTGDELLEICNIINAQKVELGDEQ